ncbi:hypothetical protein TrRE_jg4828 [Triparma retinervis]|uniref:Uncharacterized protein n=1 Tax=Triparma retinervis TaxID=2557542 RepID=A0A9W7A864_9STRA|nr:hypothetical protein TrRE_jg4828 [Triparma retinervis]
MVEKGGGGPTFLLDVNTKGGALFYSLVLFVVPIVVYVYQCNTSSLPSEEIGRNIGFVFTTAATLLWTATYLVRVANKDMTYAKQLKDYEDGVIQRRLEELDDEEREGLLEEIEREEDRF